MRAHCEQGLRKIVAAALLMGAAQGHAQAQQETAWGQVSAATAQNAASTDENVAAVRIVTEDGHVLSEAPAGLAVAIGKRLNGEQVAESIRALYRTGDYADLRAISTPVEGGVRVDFVAREQLFFNQVVIHGLVSPPSEASAIAAVQLSLGEPYQADAVNEGLERLRELLREEGFYAAQVLAQTVPHLPNHEMDVIINIQPGSRARIKEIELKNGTEYRDAEILSRSKLKAGRGLTAAHVQRDARVSARPVPVARVSGQVADGLRHLSERRFDLLQADNVRLLRRDPVSKLLVTRSNPIDVPGTHFHVGAEL